MNISKKTAQKLKIIESVLMSIFLITFVGYLAISIALYNAVSFKIGMIIIATNVLLLLPVEFFLDKYKSTLCNGWAWYTRPQRTKSFSLFRIEF